MPTVDWITIKGLKSIKRIDRLPLQAINVLIGANGAGKSNFVRGFSFLRAIGAGQLQNYVGRSGGADKLLHFGSKVTECVSIHIAFHNGQDQYRIKLVAGEANDIFPMEEVTYVWDNGRSTPLTLPMRGLEAALSDPRAPHVGHLRDLIVQWHLYHFNDTSSTSPMKKTGDVNDNRYLRPDGANLSAFLYYLRQEHEGSYRQIRSTVQLVAPFFDDFALTPLALNENKIRLEWQHRGTDTYLDVSSLSDGTLRFIALATLLLQPASLRPSVILIDEPEIGLHPYAIAMLASLVKQASVETQIVLATQSSLLLDQFQPEDVIVADRVRGRTELRRLDGEQLKEWLEDYSLGQLWEKNEFGGRPVHEDTA